METDWLIALRNFMEMLGRIRSDHFLEIMFSF